MFSHYKQIDSKDCGPTCLKIIAKHYGKTINIQDLRAYSETGREGSNLLFLSDAAEKIGFRTLGVKVNLKKLDELPLPCILHWNKNHYVVLYEVPEKKKIFKKAKKSYKISDPAIGLINYSEKEFLDFWIGKNANEFTEEGIALLIEPTPKFSQTEFDKEENNQFGFSLLFQYLLPYKSFMFQLAVGLFAGSILQLIFPFLTQSIVDVGVQNKNISFVYLVLIAQLFLFLVEQHLS